MDTNNTAAAQDEAAAFIPVERNVRFEAQDITVRPLNVLQAIQVSRAMKAVLPSLDRVQALLARADEDLAEPGADEIGIVVELLADFGEPLTEGIALAVGKPLAFVRESRDYRGLVALVSAILRVNADFFAQQVGPYLAGLRNAAADGDGQTPSIPLSAPATH